MREIIFEYGFQSVNGILKKQYRLNEIPYIREKCDVWNVLPLVYVRQYTGLKDKNGKLIFEGDILSSYSPCIDKSLPWKPATFYRVGWHESGCWNLFKTMSDEHIGITGICLSNLQWYTVVGNIHENHELIK